MYHLLNDLPELVYIVNPDTYEILFINEFGKKTFHIDSLAGRKCYEVFQNLDAPCPFCTTEILRENETYTWERYNPVAKRHYLLKDRLGIIDGQRVRTEVAIDITEQETEKQALRSALEAEKMVLECVRQLHQHQEPAQGIQAMLEVLGQTLDADRAYIFEFRDQERMDNTYEWCAKHVLPQIDNLRDMDVEEVERWMVHFRKGECVIIDDVADIQGTLPGEYSVLEPQRIHSLVTAPLEVNGEICGFLGVDNPDANLLHNIVSLLQTLRYFLSASLRRMADTRRFQEMSQRDLLTGLYNRNRYMEDIEQLQNWRGPIGMTYMDLNGLKILNDQYGHDRGDEALRACARIMQESFPGARCYRIGGDEFVAVDTHQEADVFLQHVQALRESFRTNGGYQTAVGNAWAMGPIDLQLLMHQADARMYDDKRRFYRDSSRDRRRAEPTAAQRVESTVPKEYDMLMSAMHITVSKHLLREDFRLLWANDCFYKLTGYSRDEFQQLFGDNIALYFQNEPQDFENLRHLIFDAYQSGKTGYEARMRVLRKNQTHVWIDLKGIFTDEKVDGASVIYTVFTDVTDLMHTRKEQDVTFDNLPGFVFKVAIRENDIKLMYGNREFESLFGKVENGNSTDLMRRNMVDNAVAIGRCMQQMRQGEPVSLKVVGTNLHGGSANYQACGGCVDWELDEPVYLFVCIDITEIMEQRSQMQELAYVDAVTGGRNRARFELDANAILALAQPGEYVLASLDLQKFKVVNDLFGIEAGDKTLRHVYACIQRRLDAGECVGRLSADTFMLLLKSGKPDVVEARIQALAEDINDFNRLLTHKYLLQMAVGLYPIDDPTMSVMQLQDRANMARKQIKGTSSLRLCACKFYSHSDRIRMAREKDIENRMSDALRDGQFVVYYQPKLCLQTGKIVGAEALVRWQDPGVGLVPPDDFIPLFESNGFIVQLDLYVFEQVCSMLRRWLDCGRTPMTISVNMSKAHLYDGDFLQNYERIRMQYDVPASLLELEVTETLIFENPQRLSRVIDDIHRCGYFCSMDDFGSGYSSLNVLRQVRVDTLKLDRAFLSSERMDDERACAVIKTVVELAKRLKLTTVAEGVETEGQADFLRQAGCDSFQGFLFSKPVPLAQFEDMAFGS